MNYGHVYETISQEQCDNRLVSDTQTVNDWVLTPPADKTSVLWSQQLIQVVVTV